MIQRHQIHVGSSVRNQDRHPVKDVDGPAEGHARAECHKCIHVRRTVKQRLESGGEEVLVDDHHGCRQEHLCQCQSQMIVREECRERPSPHIVAHGDVHQDSEEEDGILQPPDQFRCRVILQGFLLRPESGACASFAALCAFLPEAGTVAGLLNRRDDSGAVRRSLDAHRIGQKRDRDRLHTRHLRNRLFNMSLAGRAAHSCYCILCHRRSFLSAESASVALRQRCLIPGRLQTTSASGSRIVYPSWVSADNSILYP